MPHTTRNLSPSEKILSLSIQLFLDVKSQKQQYIMDLLGPLWIRVCGVREGHNLLTIVFS